MEFKKTPAPAAVPQVQADVDAQLKHTLRVMASRQLYGARGLLLILGSILLVVSLGMLFATPQPEPGATEKVGSAFERMREGHSGRDEWLAVADVVIAVAILLSALLVTRMPLACTLLPVGLLAGKAFLTVGFALTADQSPPILITALHLAFAGLCCKGVVDALAYRREAEIAREHYRSAAIMLMKEARQ